LEIFKKYQLFVKMVKMKIINYRIDDYESVGPFVEDRPAHGVRGKPSNYDGSERGERRYSRRMAPNSHGRNNGRRTEILSSIDSCAPLKVKVI
jgi:hypothetical protein